MKLVIVLGLTLLSLATLGQSMKFVAVRNNPTTQRQEFIQWDTLSLPNVINDSASITGLVSGSSTFNSNTGNYCVSALRNNQSITLSYDVNTRSNTVLANQIDFGISTKVDLSNGKLYTIQGKKNGKRSYITVTNPITNATTLVDSLPGSIFAFIGEGMVFNSNNHHFYFQYVDTANQMKFMDVDLSGTTTTMTSSTLGMPTNSGSYFLEFDLNSNVLYFLNLKYNSQTRRSKIFFGNINLNNGAVNFEDSVSNIRALIYSSVTFDQTGQNMCVSVIDSNNQNVMLCYQVLNSYWFTAPLPAGSVYEIEANNYSYAQAKYASTSVKELNAPLLVYPNPAQDFLQVSGAGLGNRYRIFNQNGQLVLSGKISQNEEKIDVSELNSGLFLFMMEGTKTVSKFIIN
jgi:Secretion system C-terminal sorting domain